MVDVVSLPLAWLVGWVPLGPYPLTMSGIWETLGVAWLLKAELGVFLLETGGWTGILHLN